jgi:hypothetical protein
MNEVLSRFTGKPIGKFDISPEADLCEADLCGADLFGANLSGADLFGADLREADLRRADLRGANLSGADLRGADLFGANLSGADLRRADLFEADLRGANLSGADLRGADIDFTCWPLWCGSQDVKIDKKQAAQLLAHAFNAAQSVRIKPTKEQAEFINSNFHGIQSGEFPEVEEK